MRKLDIQKMLVISTGHITKDTADNIMNNSYLPVFEKSEYGWWICIPEYINLNELAEDLRAVVKLAMENECTWLCLDGDGCIVDELPLFEW